jgi:hypothetical protein
MFCSPMHWMTRPLGDGGQPPLLQTPVASTPSGHSQLMLKSTHQCSPVNEDEMHAPPGQSSLLRHGSHVLPVPWHDLKRCEQVATPKSSSK